MGNLRYIVESVRFKETKYSFSQRKGHRSYPTMINLISRRICWNGFSMTITFSVAYVKIRLIWYEILERNCFRKKNEIKILQTEILKPNMLNISVFLWKEQKFCKNLQKLFDSW